MSDGLISANQLKNQILGDIGEMTKIGVPITRDYLWRLINHAIEDAPIVDAVEVVRCKDCKWWDSGNGKKGYCHAVKHDILARTWEASMYRHRISDENFYCADGEPKNDEKHDKEESEREE
jgi:hypothetical protein